MPSASATPPSTVPVIVSIDGPVTAAAPAVPVGCVSAPDPINPSSGQMGPCVLFIGEPEFPTLPPGWVAVADPPVPHVLPATGFSSSSLVLVASLLVAAGGLMARRRREVT